MRFLLELVPCCGTPTQAWRKAPGSPTPPPPPESEDDHNVRSSLVPPPPPPLRLQKRVRTVAWSPSLGAISEDREVVVGQRRAAVSVGFVREGTGGRMSGVGRAGAPDRDGRRRDRDEHEYGRVLRRSYLSAMMIPAFSPTPFVF